MFIKSEYYTDHNLLVYNDHNGPLPRLDKHHKTDDNTDWMLLACRGS